MSKRLFKVFSITTILALMLVAVPMQSAAAAGSISLTSLGATYSQDFNTLASSGTANTIVPTGWEFSESGSNANTTYRAGTGSDNTGDTYSFGATANAERAFGGLRSGNLVPLIGSQFTNNTGGTITSLDIAYTGEQWRLGQNTTGRAADRLDFQLSTNAASITTGTWTDYDGLDFSSPVVSGTVGGLNGNVSPNRTAISFTITGLSIPNGTTFWLRWADSDLIPGADDGLSVDDFSLKPNGTVPTIDLAINDVSANEGNSGTTTFTFTVGLSAPAGAGGVTFDIATADNTATVADNDYVAKSLTSQTFPAGSSTYTFDVLVNGDTNVEPDETFFVNVTNVTGATIADGQGQGTIVADDAAPTPTNPSGNGSATPNAVLTGDSTLLTVAVTPGTNPTSTGLVVSCDLTAIGGSASQAFYDDATNGDATAGDNTFSYSATVANNTTGGAKSLLCTITDVQTRTVNATISLTVTAILPIGTVNGAVSDTEDATLHRSPFAPASGNGSSTATVTVQGVIYEKTLQATATANTNKGFFLQNTTATADANPKTSDGIFVFMGNFSTLIGGYTPTVGDEVVITAKVSEFFNMTELTSATVVKVVRSNVNIDTEVSPVVANPPANLADANRYWERLQSMRVQVPANSIVLGGRNVFSPADAEIWLANPDSTIAQRADPYTRRSFRDAHPLDDNYDPNNWDGNGYRMLIGSLGIKSLANDKDALIDPARTFDTLSAPVAGGINYTFSKYRIEISGQPSFNEGPDPAANHAPQAPDRATEYSIVDYNVENLYDYRDNPFSGCDFTGDSGCPKVAPFLSAVNPPYDYVPASDAVYQARLNDIATEIIDVLHAPDILMMQEVENQDICTVTGTTLTCGTTDNADGRPDDLQELALKIKSLGGPTYDAAFDRNSSDLRGIAPSFMYRTDRVQLLPAAGDPILDGSPAIPGYTAVSYDGDTSNPKTLNAVYTGTGACETSYVFPRAPDIGLFRIYANAVGDANYRDVYVVDNHFKSGPDTCVSHRKEQANYNAALVAFLQAAKPDANIVVGGDLNVYAHPDNNSLTAVDQLAALYDPGIGLKNLYEVELNQAPEAAYTYVFQGMAQTIDQVFVNKPLFAHLSDVRTAHINSDFPADYPGDVARGTSDHDPTAVRLLFNLAPVVATPSISPEPSTEGQSVTASASFSDPDGSSDGPFTCTVNYGDGSGDLAGVVNGSTCTGTHTYATYGVYTVTVNVTDKFGGTGSNSASHTVIFNWSGFFQPVDNLPTFNVVKAGSGIPVKFSLAGNKGLNIFAAGYPVSQPIACATGAPTDTIEQTVTAGSSSLSYDATTNTYTYVWKTDKSWASTCRQLTVVLVDGTTHVANFSFTK